MTKKQTFELNLKDLNLFSRKLSKLLKPSDILLLEGELGVGKTTFTRFLISSIYINENILTPPSIKSPTFPIIISYNLSNYELFHYDFYRINKINELDEIGFFENIRNNITIIEWPEIIEKKINNYYKIKFSIIDQHIRKIILSHSTKDIII